MEREGWDLREVCPHQPCQLASSPFWYSITIRKTPRAIGKEKGGKDHRDSRTPGKVHIPPPHNKKKRLSFRDHQFNSLPFSATCGDSGVSREVTLQSYTQYRWR